MAEKILVPIYLPRWVRRPLGRLRRALSKPVEHHSGINIYGERNIEWSFLCREMPNGPGKAVEFGCEQGFMSLYAAQKGYKVIANDLQEQRFQWFHPDVEFLLGDFLTVELPQGHFDVAINCSSVEHVGVAGRYGIETDQDDGDLTVMKRLADVLRPGGLLLMSAPCGLDTVMAPWCRVYGEKRLPKLFEGFQVLKRAYWLKDERNRWVESTESAAMQFKPINHPLDPHECLYALGCFVLCRRGKGSPGS